MGYSILILFLVVYAFFVLCQGAVGWHRRLVLGERPLWASPVPGYRAFHYALAVVAFGVFLVLAHFGTSILAGPFLHDAFVSFPDLGSMTSPVEMGEAIRLAMRPLQIIFFLISLGATLALLTAGEAWLFVFPHISADTGHVAFRHIRHSLHPPKGLIAALTIVGLLPSFIWLIYGLFVPMSIQFQTTVMNTSVGVTYALALFCLLWGLSILSIAYREAVVVKAPGEGAKSDVPA